MWGKMFSIPLLITNIYIFVYLHFRTNFLNLEFSNIQNFTHFEGLKRDWDEIMGEYEHI